MSEIISKTIRNRIVENGVGQLYTVKDFNDTGNDAAVTRTLSRLQAEQMLVRIAQGVYLYPQMTEYGIRKPTLFETAQAIAAKEHATIIPSGMTALNELGLSTQIPMKAVFVTNGTTRNIKVGNRTIVFKHASPKIFAYKTSLFPMIVLALKELGEGNVDEETMGKINAMLANADNKEELLHDYRMIPVWMKKLINIEKGEDE